MISLTVASWGNAGVYYISIPLCKDDLPFWIFYTKEGSRKEKKYILKG